MIPATVNKGKTVSEVVSVRMLTYCTKNGQYSDVSVRKRKLSHSGLLQVASSPHLMSLLITPTTDQCECMWRASSTSLCNGSCLLTISIITEKPFTSK